MASSKKPLSRKIPASAPKKTKNLSLLDLVDKAFVSLLESHKKIKSMTVALSGGVDSVVLLHLLHQLQKTHHFTLKASHVHHGLSKNADKWVKFCEKLCTKLSVPLDIHYIQLPQKKSLGIEGEARRLRYEKLLQSVWQVPGPGPSPGNAPGRERDEWAGAALIRGPEWQRPLFCLYQSGPLPLHLHPEECMEWL